jgi:hypothetical protein
MQPTVRSAAGDNHIGLTQRVDSACWQDVQPHMARCVRARFAMSD